MNRMALLSIRSRESGFASNVLLHRSAYGEVKTVRMSKHDGAAGEPLTLNRTFARC